VKTPKKATRKNIKKSSRIKNVERYTFNSIFTINPIGTISTNFPIIINGLSYGQGTLLTPTSPFLGGVNIFNNIGKDISGTFNPSTRVVSIQGFYYG